MFDLLKHYINHILKLDFFRFCVVGIIATVVHYGVYYILLFFINTNVAYTIGYMLSFCLNFWLSAKFTFKTETTTKRGIGFALSHLINYGLQLIVLNLGLIIGIPEPLAPIPVYLICVPVNFILVRFVFKREDS